MPTAICTNCSRVITWSNTRGSRLADLSCCGPVVRAQWIDGRYRPAPSRKGNPTGKIVACALCGRRRRAEGRNVKPPEPGASYQVVSGPWLARVTTAVTPPPDALICWSHEPKWPVSVCDQPTGTRGETMSETSGRPAQKIHVEALKCRDCGRIGLGVDGKRITGHKCTGIWDIVIAADCEVTTAPETAAEHDRLRESNAELLAACKAALPHFAAQVVALDKRAAAMREAGLPASAEDGAALVDAERELSACRRAIAEAEKG